jgi:hypothetical protein
MFNDGVRAPAARVPDEVLLIVIKFQARGIRAALITAILSLLAAVPLGPAAAETGPVETKGLVDKPLQISYTVSKAQGSKWIRLDAEYETAYPVSAATVVAILANYEGIPRILSRVASVKVLERLPDGAIIEQRSGVKAFGIEFYTTVHFHNRTLLEKPGNTTFFFDQIDSGGTMENCSGFWQVIDRSSPGSPLVLIRYRLTFDVLDQFPGQEPIMRSFGPGDIERTLRELGSSAEGVALSS